MGIKGLWPLLNGGGVEALSGDASAAKIAEMVDGKSIAVDLSVWMCQAENMGHSAYVSQVSSDIRIMKVVFERACNWLRFGCIPVAVLEGELPEAKRAAQRSRFKQRTGKEGGGFGSSAAWVALARDIGKMLRAMGLSVVQAPGEAEAMCGALNAAGLVDGVATVDGDALLFGASVVYKELSLSTAQPKACSLARCSIEAVRSRLGISSGGGDALIAVAALSGGDYNEAGTKGVGPLKALKLLTSLLEASPGSSDDGVLQALLERLRTGPDDSLAALTKCTGCKACGHDNGSGGKKCTKARGCVGCGTHPVAEGGDGSGGCRPRGSEPLSSTCRCPFHRLWLQRHLDKIVRQVGSQPRYAAAIQETASEYQRQMRMAAEKAERVKADMAEQRRRRAGGAGAAFGGQPSFEWRSRPDIASLEMTLGRLTGWTASVIRKKVLPVLLEWDVAHQQGAELVVRSVVKVSGNQGEGCPTSWRFLLDVESTERPGPACFPLPQSDAAKKPKAPPGSGAAAAPEPEPQAAGVLVKEWEFDRSCLQEPLARSVRMSSVKRHLPELVEAFHRRAKEKAAAAKEKQPSQRRRGKPSGPANSRPITQFFAVVKAPGRAEPVLRESRVTSNAPSIRNPDAGSPPKKQKMPVSPDATSLPDEEEPRGYGRGHTAATVAESRIAKNAIEDLPRSRLFEESLAAGQYPGSDPLLDSPPPGAPSPTTESICSFRRGHTAATAAERRVHEHIPRSRLFEETLAVGQCPGGDPLLDSPPPGAPSPTSEENCTFRRGHTAATGAEPRTGKDKAEELLLPRSTLFEETLAAGQCPGGDPLLDSPLPAALPPTSEETCAFRRGHTAATGAETRIHNDKARDLLLPRSRLCFEETLAAGQYPGGDPLLDSPGSKAGASGRQMAARDHRIASASGAKQPVMITLGSDDSDADEDPSVIDLTQSTPPTAKSNAAADDDVIVLS